VSVVMGSKHLQPLKTVINTSTVPIAECQQSFFTINIKHFYQKFSVVKNSVQFNICIHGRPND
jgi:hypothetical protein